MWHGAQAGWRITASLRIFTRIGCLAIVGAPLFGCAAGISLKSADVDPAVLTSSTDKSVKAPITPASDEVAVRNAVSSADVETRSSQLPWANAATGSRGIITALTEEKQGDTRCRNFTTSRESFDGVAIYNGSACMTSPGIWQLQTFVQSGS